MRREHINIKKDSLKNYNKLLYIEGTGTQYIDTGYKPNNNSYLWLDFESTQSTKGYNWIAYTRWTGGPNYDSWGVTDASSANYYLYIQAGNSNYNLKSFGQDSSNWLIQRHIAEYDGVTNVGKVDSYTANFTNETYQSSCNFVLMGFNNNGTTEPGKVKIYGCIIKENNVVIHNFVPYLRLADNKPGLYDIITKQFFTNAGTGEFLYTEYYTDLQYIKCTGTQYIDTLYKPNQNTEIIYSCCQTGNMNYSQAQTFLGVSNGIWSDNACAVSTFRYGSYGWDGMGNSGWASFTVIVNQDTVYKLNKDGFYINNSLVRSNTGYTLNQMARNLTFCAANYNSVTEYGQHRIYSAQIKENNILVRDFIPKLRYDGKPGLYDTINDVFYTNQGTGEFQYA